MILSFDRAHASKIRNGSPPIRRTLERHPYSVLCGWLFQQRSRYIWQIIWAPLRFRLRDPSPYDAQHAK
jgi:hypothetical protein